MIHVNYGLISCSETGNDALFVNVKLKHDIRIQWESINDNKKSAMFIFDFITIDTFSLMLVTKINNKKLQ